MASIPLFLRGKDLASVTLFPQTVGTSGILADASTKGVTAQVDSFQLNLSPTDENISAVNQPRANHMVIEDDFSFSLSLIEVHNASDPEAIGLTILTNDVFRIVFVKGTQAGSIQTWQCYATRGAYSNGVNGKGKQVVTGEFHAVDTGSTAYLTRTIS